MPETSLGHQCMEGTSERGGTVGIGTKAMETCYRVTLQLPTSVTQKHMDLDLLPMPEST